METISFSLNFTSLKYGDIVLKARLSPEPTAGLWPLRPGTSLTADVPTQQIGLLLPAVQKIREAANRSEPLQLKITGPTTPAGALTLKCRVESIVPALSPHGSVQRIALRTL